MFQPRALAAVAALVPMMFSAPALAAGTAIDLRPALVADIASDQVGLVHRNVSPARVISAYAEMPGFEAAAGTAGHAVVQIDMSKAGIVTAAHVKQSSGKQRFDDAAVTAAFAGRYAPATVDGTAVAGSYLLDVDFTP